MLHERRKQLIRLHKRGVKPMQLVAQKGRSWTAVNRALKLFAEDGWALLRPVAKGRELGAEQQAQIRALICEKRPEQLKMEFALWTRAAVMQ